MSRLRATLVTPLTGPLVRFGRESATALSLWAEHATDLPPPWTGVHLDVLDANPDPESAMRAAVESRPDVLFGPYGSSPMVAAARVTNRAIWNHGGAASALSRPSFPHVINVLSPASSYFSGVLEAVRAADAGAGAVSVLHGSSGFGRDVASGAVSAAGALGFRVRAVPFSAGHAAEVATTLPDSDLLLQGPMSCWSSAVSRTKLPQRECCSRAAGGPQRSSGRGSRKCSRHWEACAKDYSVPRSG
jgi:branched-chain amino acid transport system substrate-binding protein